MDSYDILGISRTATPEEIKKAYRREAMKWHPDRCNNSAQAKERFHRAAEAYRILSAGAPRGGSDGFETGPSAEQWHGFAESEPPDRDAGARDAQDESTDNFADSVFWEVMLDYAIKLAQTGLGEHEIAIDISRNGCPQRLAAAIADKAFNIHAHYASPAGGKRKQGADKSTFKEERLETDLLRAFLGQRNLFWSPRDTIEYYLVAFGEFRHASKTNPLSWINLNRRLMRILNFSFILFVVIAVTIHFYPGPSKYKLLPDVALLQVPLGVLALMFAWTIYRKLWVVTLVFGSFFVAVLAFFNAAMPRALYGDTASMLPIAATCFAPFVVLAMFANFFYYRKGLKMVATANRLFDEHLDKLVWIKNRAGTSSMAAFMFMLVSYWSFISLAPWNDELADRFGLDLPGVDIVKNDADEEKVRLRLEQASRFFEIAESHFSDAPPDYIKAEMAYSTAADYGSLLAAYKLGYLYYSGEGVEQSDVLALEYFERAINAPLAFQPHSLQLTTQYLAESYNNLGVMYQGGYGTRKNSNKARDMFMRGVEFGSGNAKLNLASFNKSGVGSDRKRLLAPTYN